MLLSLRKLLSLAILFTSLSFAQVDRATLSGTITDPSDAQIAAATVAVESAATGLRRETTTSATGAYQLPALPPGTYTISISKA